MRRLLLASLAALSILAVAVPAASASRFFGVVSQGPLTQSDFERMRGTVGTLRVPFYWFQLEPERGRYDFAATDELVGMAAAAGVRVLPFVWGTPSWLAESPARPPLESAAARRAWAGLLRALVRRYGARGEFWDGRRAVRPIRRWQVWNEPNYRLFWAPEVSPLGYARLLGIAATAIRGEDPGARIVLAGVAPIAHSPPPWIFLRQLLRIPSVGRDFDVAAVHPYASSLLSLAGQVEEVRAAMAAAGYGDRPLEVTEFGLASGPVGVSSLVKSRAGQAAFLRRAYGLLGDNRRRWRLVGADWFSWRDGAADPRCVFCQGSGLFDARDRPKPAWRVFARLARTQLSPPPLLNRARWGDG
jgi:polysaccharide biosynthesis protein PslG